ncbi:MAG: hypothetical protein GX556_08140 [Fibrobacter sp.]|nr:hypothetical protein [Fibrobacter sp.]
MLQPLEERFVEHVQKWADDYRDFIETDNYRKFSMLTGTPGYYAMEDKTGILKENLERQIAFVQYCATCMFYKKVSEKNLETVMKFVSFQRDVFYDLVGPNPIFIVNFILLCKGVVYLFVSDLDEIDYSDIYSASFFTAIAVNGTKWKTLTEKRLQSTIKLITDNMARSKFNITFEVPPEYQPSKTSNTLFVATKVDGAPSIDKVLNIRKTINLFKIEFNKLFEPDFLHSLRSVSTN